MVDEERLEEEVKGEESVELLDYAVGKFCRVYHVSMGTIRCLVKGSVVDPAGRPLLHVILPGRIISFLYFDSLAAIEIFESMEQLHDIVEQEKFNDMRGGRQPMTYNPLGAGGEMIQP